MATKRTKVLLSVYLEPEQAARLRAHSKRSGVPVAVLIRRGVDYMLSKAPVDPLAVIATDPGFVDSLSPVEHVALANLLGLLPSVAT